MKKERFDSDSTDVLGRSGRQPDPADTTGQQEPRTADMASAGGHGQSSAMADEPVESLEQPSQADEKDALRDLVTAFYRDPAKFKRLTDPYVPLPSGLSAFLEDVANLVREFLPQEKEESRLEESEETRDELIKATLVFVDKVLLPRGGDHYRALGLSAQANSEDIQKHYRYLRRLFWNEERGEVGKTSVMRISEAYVVLRDASRRRAYNEQLMGRQSNVYIGAGADLADVGEERSPVAARSRTSRVLQRNPWRKAAGLTVVLAVAVLAAYWYGLFPGGDQSAGTDPIAIDGSGETNGEKDLSGSERDLSLAGNQLDRSEVDTAARVDAPSADLGRTAMRDTAATDNAEAEVASPSGGTASEGLPKDPVPSSDDLLERVERFVSQPDQPLPPETEAPPPGLQETSRAQPKSPDSVQSDQTLVRLELQRESGVSLSVTPVAPSSGLSEAAVETEKRLLELRVDELLNRAQRQYDRSRLTQPLGDNALDTYQEILRLDPENAAATAGLIAISDRYVALARFRLQRERYDEAIDMVGRGLAVVPDHEPLLLLLEEIDQRRNQSAFADAAPSSSEEEFENSVESGQDVALLGSDPSELEPEEKGSASLAVVPVAPLTDGSDVASGSVEETAASEEDAPDTNVALLSRERVPQASATGGITDDELTQLIGRFVTTYEAGDLDAFMSLFSDNARTNNRFSKNGVREDYEELFESTEGRLIRLKDMRWSREENEAIGEADFRLTIVKNGDTRPRSYEGSLTFRLEKQDQTLTIKGLFHQQRKADR